MQKPGFMPSMANERQQEEQKEKEDEQQFKPVLMYSMKFWVDP